MKTIVEDCTPGPSQGYDVLVRCVAYCNIRANMHMTCVIQECMFKKKRKSLLQKQTSFITRFQSEHCVSCKIFYGRIMYILEFYYESGIE